MPCKNMMKRLSNGISYTIVRSARKTMAVQVKRDGTVTVRCPMRIPDETAAAFVRDHADWIEEKAMEARKRQENRLVLTEAQIRRYREEARQLLERKTAFWAEKMAVTYGRIAIRQQATRWGSCSARGNLNFNWTIVLLPEPLQDYLVVHELAHRREMNHSPRFWKVVEEQLPDYSLRQKQLRNYENLVEVRKDNDSKMDGLR